MDTTSSRIYYFLFGYHHPDAWEVIQNDKNFDFESTGVLPIHAKDETAAFQWGKHLAMWYVSKLFLDHSGLTYNWSPDEYACWIETSLPVGCEECISELGEIVVNSYPEFDELKMAMQD